MKHILWTGLVLFGGLFICGTAVAANGNAENGKALFVTCAVCHGANGEGNRALNAPASGGQNEWYVLRQLTNFCEGIRGADAFVVFIGERRRAHGG